MDSKETSCQYALTDMEVLLNPTQYTVALSTHAQIYHFCVMTITIMQHKQANFTCLFTAWASLTKHQVAKLEH